MLALVGEIILLAEPTPAMIHYQGRISVNGVPFEGTGRFKFALVGPAESGSDPITLWSNDDSSENGSEPATAVSLLVSKGLYAVLLGNTNLTGMTARLMPDHFQHAGVALRVWFDNGTDGFKRITPDQRVASVAYAFVAETANEAERAAHAETAEVAQRAHVADTVAAGVVGSTQLADGSVTAAKFAPGALDAANVQDGTIGTAQLADGSVTETKLDPDLSQTLVRLDASQTLNGENTFARRLDLRGGLQAGDTLRLDAEDGPMVVRDWTPFTSGADQGVGRWGLFMEPATLFLGVAGSDYEGTSSIALGGWRADGTREDWMALRKGGNVGIGTGDPQERLEVAGAVTIGTNATATPKAGTLRWTGSSFEGFDGTNWVSLRSSPGLSPAWLESPDQTQEDASLPEPQLNRDFAGQSFRAGKTGLLSAITIKYQKVWGVSGTLTVYEGAGRNGSPLATQTFDFPQGFENEYFFEPATIRFDLPARIEAGREYSFVVSPRYGGPLAFGITDYGAEDPPIPRSPYEAGNFFDATGQFSDLDLYFRILVSIPGGIELASQGGNVGIGTSIPSAKLEVVGNVKVTGDVSATTFTTTSDRQAKEGFAGIDAKEVLTKVTTLPITGWNFKEQPGVRHLGPMAQDFHAAFGLGTDDKHIATVDADGVALAAIQGLHQEFRDQEVELRGLREQNARLAARLQQLETAIQALRNQAAMNP